MPKSPIYLKFLELKNIRTFGEVTLNLEKENGNLPQWTLIIGDNCMGKSTLLQSVVWMKPNVPYFEDGIDDDKISVEDIEANINNEENDTLVRLVRKTGSSKEVASIKAKFVANRIFDKKSELAEDYCEQSIDIKTQDGKLIAFPTNYQTNNEDIFLKNDVVIYAYSASRKPGKTNLNDVNLDDTVPSFISDNTILYDAQEILHRINYAWLGAIKKEKIKYKRYLEKIKEVLVAVLPDFEAVKDISISSPKLIKNRLQEIEVMISTKHGNMIPFNDFSLGYKTVASWIVDLSWRLINQYPDSKVPLSQPAIVIVDEIDLHLHPIWQREIITNLSNHFPKVQFIATAHSPLMVQSALNANYAVLQNGEKGVEIINEPKDIDGWRVDQILTSEFFGLKTARSPDYEILLIKKEELLRKPRLSIKQKKDLENISNKIAELPSGEDPEDIENREFISNVVSKLKASKTKIEI